MILFTKLNIPKTIFPVQYRKRLIEKLNKGIRGSLTLINSVAGSGKSTLVGEWLTKEKLPYVWYSLDRTDNDLRRFILHLIAGFQKLRPDFGKSIVDALSIANHMLVRNVLIELINEIYSFNDPVIVVLDDYQLITLDEIHETITFLLEHYHPKLRLVIISRNLLPIPTQKLKIRKQFTEIGFREIRFQDKEIQRLCKVNLNKELTLTEAQTVYQKTEGWIAAIQLLFQSNDKNVVEMLPDSLSGKKLPIIQYLMEEVIDNLPEPVFDFLTKTAFLNRFCLSLCDDLDIIFDNDSFTTCDQIFKYILKKNLFIIPLDDENIWFRYHHLFKDFLLSVRTEKNQKEKVCYKASEWFEEQGMIEESIEYAFYCKEQDRALKLLEQQTWSKFNNCYSINNYFHIQYFKDRIDSQKLVHFPLLSLFLATHEIFSPDCQNFQLYINIAKNRSQENSTHPIDTYIQIFEHLEVLKHSSVSETTKQSMNHIISILEENNDTIMIQVNWLINSIASRLAYYWDGDFFKAEKYITKAGNLARKHHLIPVYQSIIASFAQIQHYYNPSETSLAIVSEATTYETNQQSTQLREKEKNFPCDPSLNLVASRLYYSQNEIRKAKQHIEQCFNVLSEKKSNQDIYYGFQYSLVEKALGNEQIALSVLKEAVFWKQEPAGYFFTSSSPAFESQCACLHFLRLYPGLDWLEKASYSMLIDFQNYVKESKGPLRNMANYLEISWLEYRGKQDVAMSRIEEIISNVHSSIQSFLLTLFFLMIARIKFNLNERRQAINYLDKALILISTNNMLRACIDAGSWVKTLLLTHPNWSAPVWLTDTILSELVSNSQDETQAKTNVHEDNPDLICLEPIRNKERTILDLLSRAMSYKEIANEMNYSYNTIQSYIRDLYGKLGVHSRQEAVNKAKALRLLDKTV